MKLLSRLINPVPVTPPLAGTQSPRLLPISALVAETQEMPAGATVEVMALNATPLTVAAAPPLIAWV